MIRYIDLLSLKSNNEIISWKSRLKDGENPKNIKDEFAQEIVERFYNHEAFIKAKDDFKKRSLGQTPEKIICYKLKNQGDLGIPQILKQIDFVKSTSEALRLIKSGGIRVDSEKIDATYNLQKKEFIIQVGKRKFGKIIIT